MAGRPEAPRLASAPVDEEGGPGEPHGDEVHRDHVVQDLLVPAGERDDGGDGSLQRDRQHRHARARVEPSDAAEEDAVAGHRVVDARGGQDALGEEAEGRDRDADRDEARAALAEGEAHDVGGGSGARGEALGPERAQADDVDREVEHHDAGDTQQERARHVALGPLQLAHDEAGGLPAAVGEEDGHEGGAEGSQEAQGRRPVEHRPQRDALAAEGREADRHQPEDGDGLQHHQQRLDVVPGPHAEAVDAGQRGQGEDGHGRLGQRHRHELAEVAGEGHGHRGHPAALRDEEQRPAVEKGDPRAVGLAQVGVLPAHRGAQRGELGVDEGPGEGDEAAEAPRGQDERRRAHLPRHDVGVHEDARPDDAPHHEHRGAEGADLAGERRRARRSADHDVRRLYNGWGRVLNRLVAGRTGPDRRA